MALAVFSLENWTRAQAQAGPVQVGDFQPAGGALGSGHPQTIVVIVSSNQYDTALVLFGTVLAAADPNHYSGVTATLVAVNPSEPDGINYYLNGLPQQPFGPDGFWAGEIGLSIAADNANDSVNISLQVGTSDDPLPVDDPPSPDGIMPPTNLTATANGDHNVLEWLDNSDNELGFEIEWSGVPAAVWEYFASAPADATSYEDYDIESGEVYSYRVRAFKFDLASIYSNIATTEDQPLVLTPESGPIGGQTPFVIEGAFNPIEDHEVLFGGVPATDLEINEEGTELSGLTPAHDRGLVDVKVTRGATEDILEDSFTYTVGKLYPHLEVSESQNFPIPLPNSVVLTAVVVDDPDGMFDEATWQWELVSSPNTTGADGITITSPSTPNTSVVARNYEQGIYLFRVTATGVNVVGLPISIEAIAQSIIATDSVPKVQSLTLNTQYPNAAYVDPYEQDDGNNGPLTYQWDQIGGPGSATIVTPNSRSTQITFPPTQGVYSFKLSVANSKYTGVGITKIANYSSTVAATVPPLSTMTVNINGTDY